MAIITSYPDPTDPASAIPGALVLLGPFSVDPMSGGGYLSVNVYRSSDAWRAGGRLVESKVYTAGQGGWMSLPDLFGLAAAIAAGEGLDPYSAILAAIYRSLRDIFYSGGYIVPDSVPSPGPAEAPPIPTAGILVPADDSRAATRSFVWRFAPLPALPPGSNPIVSRTVHFVISSVDIGLLNVPLAEGDTVPVPGQLGAGDHAVINETLINAAGLEGGPKVSEFDVPAPA